MFDGGTCPCSYTLAPRLTLVVLYPSSVVQEALPIRTGSRGWQQGGSCTPHAPQAKPPSTEDGVGQAGWSWDYVLV